MLLLRLAASQEEQIDSATLADLLDAIAAAHDDFAYEAAMELLVTHLTPDDQELLPHLERLAVGLRPLLLRRAARGNGQADRLFETLGRQGPAAVPLICQLTTGPLATDGLTGFEASRPRRSGLRRGDTQRVFGTPRERRRRVHRLSGDTRSKGTP